jgi:hypothetical protein
MPGDAQVGLGWSAVTGATSYNVKRSTTNGGPYATIASVAGTNYPDIGLVNGTTYYYVVSTVSIGAEGADSTQVSAQPVSTAPVTLSLSLAGDMLQLSCRPTNWQRDSAPTGLMCRIQPQPTACNCR